MGTIRGANKSVLRLFKGSWNHNRTPRMTRCFTIRLTLSSGNLISGKKSCWNEQTTIPEAPTCIAEFLHVTARYAPPGWRISTPFPFKIRGKACVCGTLLSFRIDLPMSNCCSHEDSARSSTHQQWITNGAASSVNHHSTTAKDKTKRRSTAPPITRAQVNILEAKKCPETTVSCRFRRPQRLVRNMVQHFARICGSLPGEGVP